MSISFVDVTFEQGSGTTCVADKPPGTTLNDTILALVFSDTQSTVTPPAGWTLLSTQNFDNSGITLYNHVYWKVAGGSEPSTYTFSQASGAPWVLLITYRGCDTTTPIQTFNTASVNTGVSANITFGSLNAAQANSRAVMLASADNVAAWWAGNAPAGWVDRFSPQGETSQDKALTSAGATGTQTFFTTTSGSPVSFGKCGVMLVLQPSAPAPAQPGSKEYCNSIDAELN